MKTRFKKHQPLTLAQLSEAFEELLSIAPGDLEQKYLVVIAPDNGLPMAHRVYHCADHREALNRVVSQHIARGYPVSEHTMCFVYGYCREGTCCCGEWHWKACDLSYFEVPLPKEGTVNPSQA